MSRFRLLVSEALHSIRSNLSTTVAATTTVLIGMFLLGICIALGTWTVSWSNHTKRELIVHVYFCTPETCDKEASQSDKLAAQTRIEQLKTQGMVKQYRYISKEEAYKGMARGPNKDLLVNLGTNPLPDAYEVTPTRGELAPKIGTLLRNSHLAGVQKVDSGGKTTKRVLRLAKYITYFFLFTVIILLAASTALIANTIRLSIFSRRREIEVMKLVGATNWFVRGPFMIEGLICGFSGALLAVIMLTITKAIAFSAFNLSTGAGSDVHALAFPLIALLMLMTGLTLGALGTGITLRRFLQV